MGAHRRRTGYFGKTGTVSRERRPRRRLTRRQFLAGTTLTGVALTLPPWLVGCGSDDDDGGAATPTPTAAPSPTPGARPRERRTLHFDFSFSPLRELRLQAIGSESHRAPILEHTAESRARHRQLNSALGDVPDERLTHYIEDVDLPADALQHVWVTGSDADGGEAVAVMHIHVPAAARQAAQQRALAAGGGDRVGRGGPAPAAGRADRRQRLPHAAGYGRVAGVSQPGNHEPQRRPGRDHLEPDPDPALHRRTHVHALPRHAGDPDRREVAGHDQRRLGDFGAGDGRQRPAGLELPGQARLPLRSRPRHRAGSVRGGGADQESHLRRPAVPRHQLASHPGHHGQPDQRDQRPHRSSHRRRAIRAHRRLPGRRERARRRLRLDQRHQPGVAHRSAAVPQRIPALPLDLRAVRQRGRRSAGGEPDQQRHQSGEVPVLDQQQLHDPGHPALRRHDPVVERAVRRARPTPRSPRSISAASVSAARRSVRNRWTARS